MTEASPRLSTVTPGARWPVGFATFYEEHYAWAVRTARLIVGRVDIAEELAQDVFIRISRRWSRIDNPRAYLRRSIVNAATRHLERRDRERDYVRSQRPGSVPPPEIAETLAALDGLTPRRRAAVVLRFYDELPDAEIADLLGCRVVTVRSLIHRALRQLKKELS